MVSTVRFTLMDRRTSATIRMDVPEDEPVLEIALTASEFWGYGKVLIVKGYLLLPSDRKVGETISEGDLIETIPDPRELDRAQGFIINYVHQRSWSGGLEPMRTSC